MDGWRFSPVRRPSSGTKFACLLLPAPPPAVRGRRRKGRVMRRRKRKGRRRRRKRRKGRRLRKRKRTR